MDTIAIENHILGKGHPCFIVAEVGINHNGDLDLAKESIRAAAKTGVDAVKFQNYRTEDFISDRTLTYEYISEGKTVVEPQYDMFKRCELTPEMLRELKTVCDECEVVFHSTPTGQSGIDELVKLGTGVLKNGSDYLLNLPLIRAMGETGLPTVLSTGMATVAEIDDAVRAFRETGNEKLILLLCTSSYPTPPDDVNLLQIQTLAQTFGCLAGFSDHTEGIVASVAAVTLGACFVEKHFTIDRSLPGPDHRFSSDPDEMKALVDAVRTCEKNLGNSRLGPTASEELGRRDFRLSCVAAKDLSEGHQLTEADVVYRRPGTGVPPGHAYLLFGRCLGTKVKAGDVLKPEHFRN